MRAALAAVVLGIAAVSCTSSEEAEPPTSDLVESEEVDVTATSLAADASIVEEPITTTPPPRTRTWFVPEPASPRPGVEFQVTFLEPLASEFRSVAWALSPCVPSGDCGDPSHYLTPSTAGYDCARCPLAITVDEDRMVDDIALGGSGPDTLLLPDDLEPGVYELCVEVRGDLERCERIDVTG